MANKKSAEKQARRSQALRERNRNLRSRLRTEVKKVRAAVAAGDGQAAKDALAAAIPVLDGTVTKGVIHANAAARTKSRLSQAVAKLG
ncbi:MAG: 30S ribosomal protein S20 [Thermoanaerobaculia bacterium]|jgi:small subunit ribosomal protein S20|nr:30S ribosomal protein S20 [Thermoanaerobaculia bacterium]MCZ7650846.1 30S ribosomal protein S20 [Thermoanaerobaculia bacterium]